MQTLPAAKSAKVDVQNVSPKVYSMKACYGNRRRFMPFNKKSARTRAKAFFQYFRGFDSNIFNKIIPGCGAVTKAGTTHPINETDRKEKINRCLAEAELLAKKIPCPSGIAICWLEGWRACTHK